MASADSAVTDKLSAAADGKRSRVKDTATVTTTSVGGVLLPLDTLPKDSKEPKSPAGKRGRPAKPPTDVAKKVLASTSTPGRRGRPPKYEKKTDFEDLTSNEKSERLQEARKRTKLAVEKVYKDLGFRVFRIKSMDLELSAGLHKIVYDEPEIDGL